MILPRPLRTLLYPLSVFYEKIVRARAGLYEKGRLRRKRLNGTVISVGNLTVGGTGKTPMVLWLAEKFLAEGKKVAILSRGYRGSGGTSDEIELLRRRLGNRVLFGVGKDRFRAGRRLELQEPVDIFLLDDGFQHLQLARDLNILMLDGSVKLRDEWLLPAGVLREPISACRRASLLIVTRKTERPDIEAQDSHKFSIFYAFCGIGNPEAFWYDLERWHVPLAGRRMFRDHHRYTKSDVRRLGEEAEQAGAKAFITTEKDEQNLNQTGLFKHPVFVAVIDFVLSSESEFHAAIDRVLAARRGAAA